MDFKNLRIMLNQKNGGYMRRILVFIGLLVILFCGYVFYQDLGDKDQANREMFDTVMAQKMDQLYVQARHWSKPLTMEVSDQRLTGDYKIMSEFILTYWMDNVEARNSYLRQLDQAQWAHFLSASRFDLDRKNAYQQTKAMLSQVHKATDQFEQKRQYIAEKALVEIDNLQVKAAMRDAMKEKLEANLHNNDEIALLQIEKQILAKAEQMFEMLKTLKWLKNKDMFLFANDQQVQKFNILYAEILEFQQQIEELKQQNARFFEGDD